MPLLFDRELLARGFLIYPVSDGWRCVSPDGRLLRLSPGDDVSRLADCVAKSDRRQTAPEVATRTVFVESAGDDQNPVAAMLATVLEPHLQVVRGVPGVAIPADVDVVVSCAGWLPDAHWQDVDRRCAAARVAWHRCHLDGGQLRLGPMTVSDRGVRYTDVRGRRLAASTVADELRELWAYLDTAPRLPSPAWPEPGSVAIAAGLLVADVLDYLAGRPIPGGECEQTIDGTEITRHQVLRLPAMATQRANTQDLSRLIDPRFGVITRLRREPTTDRVPRSFVNYTAEVANTREFAPWQADLVTGGSALDDDERARAAAIGEAVERYCGNAVPSELLAGSAADLMSGGRNVLDPADLALHSPTQYASPGFPFVPFSRDLKTLWANGRDLGTGDDVLVPAALTYLNGPGSRPGEHPAIANQAFAGIAAGTSVRTAEQAALEELIERDAVTIWWYSGAPATSLRVAPDQLPDNVLADVESTGLRLTFLGIPCAFEVPVVGVFLEDPTRGLVAFGSACRPAPAAAAEKALCEALVTYTVAEALGDPDSEFWTSVRTQRTTASPYREWRADRSYRASFRQDWRDLTTLDPNVQLYLDPAMQGEPLRRLREPAGSTDLDLVSEIAGDPHAAYVRALGVHGLRAVSVDVTTSDIAEVGLHVMRVVVPGLYQLAPAAFPLLGGTRLYTEPVARGWVPGPLTEQDIVRHPLPFA